ncbi:fibroblast growth factor 5 [Rhinophrynus dorsalis]
MDHLIVLVSHTKSCQPPLETFQVGLVGIHSYHSFQSYDKGIEGNSPFSGFLRLNPVAMPFIINHSLWIFIWQFSTEDGLLHIRSAHLIHCRDEQNREQKNLTAEISSAAPIEKKPKGQFGKESIRGRKIQRLKSSSSSSTSSLDSEGIGSLWGTSGRRTGSLYCSVGIGFHLQIHPDGKVNGSHEANHLSILEIFAVSQGIVGIRGVFSNTFLAMSKKGRLHTTPRFSDECKFMEKYLENSYNTYASATYRTGRTGRKCYVALNKIGKAKRGCSPRVKPQHISTHFLPLFKQSEPPELTFTVALPEKKKTAAAPTKPKTPFPEPKKNSSPVRYRLKFRFG